MIAEKMGSPGPGGKKVVFRIVICVLVLALGIMGMQGLAGLKKVEASVVVFNDLGSTWSGDVEVPLPNGETATARGVKVAAYGRAEVTLTITMPDRPGRHDFCAKILGANARPVLSRRLVTVEGRGEDK